MNLELQSLFSYWKSGGALLIPIGALSYAIWREFVRTGIRIQRELAKADFTEKIISKILNENDIEESALKLIENQGVFARVVGMALLDIRSGGNPIKSIISRENAELDAISRNLSVISALTVAAPLLGLLGTVAGMIKTFQAVGGLEDLTAGVADGISSALITTEFGLMVAIPGVFGAARIRRLTGYMKVRMARCRVLAIHELSKKGLYCSS